MATSPTTSVRRKFDISKSDGICGTLFEPHSNWEPPREFPNLSGVKKIGLDTETKDPHLDERGPGFIRGDAQIAGISLATEDAKWYFPMHHMGGGNMDPDNVAKFMRDLLKRDDLWVFGANLGYDLEALWSIGVVVSGKLLDIQIAEPLIEEEREKNFTLEQLCQDYLGVSKDEKLLREAAAAYGVKPKGGLWKLHSKYVGPYAEFDAWAPLKIFEKQYEKLKADNLLQIFELESRLTPLLWKMRLNGIPVDLDKAKRLSEELRASEDQHRQQLKDDCGFDVDVWSGDVLARVCDNKGIKYPRTPKGNPSFESEFLESEEHEHKFLRDVGRIRKLNRLRSTFIDDWIFGHQIKGKVHPSWRQLMCDEGGTRTGRMAAANPNPQQVPARSDLAPRVRELFVPEVGMRWAKLDYSQQEPRLLVHYAKICGMTGADLVAMAYHQNRKMDIYQFLADAAQITRRQSKDLTLGRCYGMGIDKLAYKLGISREAAKSLLDQFDGHVPFVKEMSDTASRLAQKRGWIQTICGRKRHFNYWEPVYQRELREKNINCMPVYGTKLAEAKWPGQKIQRAGAHKALNSLIQGSAADMTKAAMLLIHDNFGKVPMMAVHDELNYSLDTEEAACAIQHLAETCVKLEVPIVADLSFGGHWK